MGWRRLPLDSKRNWAYSVEKKLNSKEIATLLRRLADALESSSTEDIDALLTRRAALGIVFPDGTKSPLKRSTAKKIIDGENLIQIVERLRQADSRERGLDLLEEAKLNKKELEALARSIDLPVARDDDAEKLRQRILQATIGARLNSQAIRGF